MSMIAQAINYKGHTVYDDGRVYKAGELIAHCKTLSAAKACATRNQRADIRARQRAHHQIIQQIVTGARP